MPNRRTLERTLTQIDGRGYASYKQLIGTYQLGTIQLAIDHVQVDPYAPPSRMRVILDPNTAKLPADLTNDVTGRRAVATSSHAGSPRSPTMCCHPPPELAIVG